MKTIRLVLMIVAANLSIGTTMAFAQAQGGVAQAALNQAPPPALDPALQKTVDIDFPGGKPTELVNAVEKASKMPLNVIVSERHQDFYIPALKLRNVTVPQLFEAITKASFKSEWRRNSVVNTTSGFRMADARAGTNAVWYFFVEGPPDPPDDPNKEPICRFWQMEPYLQGLRIEDITTAIETGWKMLGINPLPRLNFHKDTKLLIVVGPPGQLAMIDDVLRQLTPKADQSTGLPNKQSGQAPGEKPSKR